MTCTTKRPTRQEANAPMLNLLRLERTVTEIGSIIPSAEPSTPPYETCRPRDLCGRIVFRLAINDKTCRIVGTKSVVDRIQNGILAEMGQWRLDYDKLYAKTKLSGCILSVSVQFVYTTSRLGYKDDAYRRQLNAALETTYMESMAEAIYDLIAKRVTYVVKHPTKSSLRRRNKR